MRIDIPKDYNLTTKLSRWDPKAKILRKAADRIALKTHFLDFLDRFETVEVIGDNDELVELKVPIYSTLKVPPLYCARYARLAARDLFGKNFAPANAWNIKYSDVVASRPGDPVFDGDYLAISDPGSIISMKWLNSRYNGEPDIEGEPIEETHVGLLLGRRFDTGTSLIVHLLGKQTRVDSPNELIGMGITPVDVYHPKEAA